MTHRRTRHSPALPLPSWVRTGNPAGFQGGLSGPGNSQGRFQWLQATHGYLFPKTRMALWKSKSHDWMHRLVFTSDDYIQLWRVFINGVYTRTNNGLPLWVRWSRILNAGDPGLIPGSGRCPGEGHGNPLQCSCLENPMDRGALRATVRGVAESWTGLSEIGRAHV